VLREIHCDALIVTPEQSSQEGHRP
jgi:hypothetical protein